MATSLALGPSEPLRVLRQHCVVCKYQDLTTAGRSRKCEWLPRAPKVVLFTLLNGKVVICRCIADSRQLQPSRQCQSCYLYCKTSCRALAAILTFMQSILMVFLLLLWLPSMPIAPKAVLLTMLKANYLWLILRCGTHLSAKFLPFLLAGFGAHEGKSMHSGS